MSRPTDGDGSGSESRERAAPSEQAKNAGSGSDSTATELPVVESRRGRLVAFLRHNWPRMVVDGAILVVWLLLTTAAFQRFALPRWLLYVVAFTGIVVYTRVTPAWRRPYRSPEQ